MPRSPTTYFLPPGTTPQVPDTPIPSSMFNAAMNDIAATFNTAQPTAYGGTGGTSITTGYDGLNARGANIATASNINLSTATGPNLHLTGTTTVATVTLAEGNVRQVIADAAFQLTASANLIVNGSTSVNYTTTPRTNLLFIGDAAGVVYVWALGGAFLPLSGGTLTSASAGTLLTLTSTDSGASAGPVLDLYRDSASPAINDILGNITFNGRDSAANKQEYGAIEAVVADPISASEDSSLDFYYQLAGARTLGLSLGAGSGTGNWTPVLSATGSTFNQSNDGRYIKIGPLVIAWGWINLANSGNTLTANNLSITGLPFTPSGLLGWVQDFPMGWSGSTTSYIALYARAQQGSSSLGVRGITAATTGGSSAALANGALHATNGTYIAFCITYRASA